jgi:hypothetical protein
MHSPQEVENLVVFNIGSQQGNISNIAGNQTNYGDQNAYIAAPPEVLDALRQVARHIGDLPLTPNDQTAARRDLQSLDQQMSTGQASPEHVSGRLSRILATARNAGAVITATSNLGSAITRIAKWLGPAGATLIGFLA